MLTVSLNVLDSDCETFVIRENWSLFKASNGGEQEADDLGAPNGDVATEERFEFF